MGRSLVKDSGCVFIRHIVGVIVSWLLYVPLSGFLIKTPSNVVVGTLMLLVYIVPSYVAMWNFGHSVWNLTRNDDAKQDYLYGLKVATLSHAPVILLSVCMVVVHCLRLDMTLFIVYKLVNVHLVGYINAITITADILAIENMQMVFIGLLSLLPVLMSWVGYIFGLHDFKVSTWVVYKQTKN